MSLIKCNVTSYNKSTRRVGKTDLLIDLGRWYMSPLIIIYIYIATQARILHQLKPVH